jgi:hypothetical protein
MNWMITMNIFRKPGTEERREYEDRRDQLYNLDYFSNGGIERRSGKDRRILKGDRQVG